MLAPLQIRRFPIQLAVALVAVVIALLLGGGLGYALRTPPSVSGSTRLIVVHDSPSSPTLSDYGCIWVRGHKAC